MVLFVIFQNESSFLGQLHMMSWGTVLWQTTKSVCGKGWFSENMHGSKKTKQFFFYMKAHLKKSWNIGKVWETTRLVLKAAGIGISGQVSRITSVGTLHVGTLGKNTKFNTLSLLHL